MARPRKPAVEGQASPVADPVPGNDGAALARIVAFFQATQPDAWEALRLCPLQHGLDDMIAKLKG